MTKEILTQYISHLQDGSWFLFFLFYFIFKLYILVLILPNIKVNLPQAHMCSPF